MAYLLSSGQPTAAVTAVNPLHALARWFGRLRAARAQRRALSTLLEMDAARLDDLGINRQDLFEALRRPYERAALEQLREQRASAWLGRR